MSDDNHAPAARLVYRRAYLAGIAWPIDVYTRPAVWPPLPRPSGLVFLTRSPGAARGKDRDTRRA
jgi:hypothetical protein